MAVNATDLHVLLADPALAGAYFVDARDRAALCEAGCALDFLVSAIDLRDCRDKADALQRFAAALQFPDWFGGNWDALADALADLSWLPVTGHLLLIDHAQDWRAVRPDDFDTLLEILDEAAARWAVQGVAFWALLPLSVTAMAE